MKCSGLVFALLAALFCVAAQAKNKDISLSGDYVFDGSLYHELGINLGTILSLESHPEIVKYKLSKYGSDYGTVSELLSEPADPVADYETVLPHASQPAISPFEKVVLTAYLNHPDDVPIAKFLAIYHLTRSLLNHNGTAAGEKIRHTIIAQYFLNRVEDLGGNGKWVEKALERTGEALGALESSGLRATAEENHEAHATFIDAFNYHEEKRYIALAELLNDYSAHPNNAFTALATTAVNLWIGGEADYDDPTVLYNFVLGGYFSIRAMALGHELEEAWQQDPVNNKRFRLATILGGFSVSHRRWLAKLHNDQAAVDLLDDEHRQWYSINPVFHAFTVGLAFFEEEENFAEGMNAFGSAFALCDLPIEEQTVTCLNRPRFSFNTFSMALSYVDFLLKSGNFGFAQGFLQAIPTVPGYEFWDIGKPAWEHRQNNLSQIFELYQNGDPSDDPTHFMMKKRKWGPTMATCQTCHQAQSKVWSEEEKNNILLPNEEYATVGNWPAVTTTWYGAVK
jgi:hypothetical protein